MQKIGMLQKKYGYVYVLLLLVLITHLNCYAQQKSIIKNAYSFYTEKLPGNIPVDANGKEIVIKRDTAITVYVETTTKLIKWDSAWFNGHCFLVVDQKVFESSVEAGVKTSDQKKAVITAAKNNFIWQLYLQMVEEDKIILQKNKNEILLKGEYNNKTFYQKAGVPVQIEGIPSV